MCVYTRSEAERSLFLLRQKRESLAQEEGALCLAPSIYALWSYYTRLRVIKVDAAETSNEQRVAVSGSAREDAAVRVADK
jgi:hypothetical protein